MKQQPKKQRKTYRGSNSYTTPIARYEYQIDIVDMVNLQKSKTQPRYVIVAIDLFSKLGDALPINNKDSSSIYNALLTMF